MPFQNYVCWDPAWAEQVMNTEALQPPRHVFLAVHHPVKMLRTTLTALKGQGGSRDAKLYTEHEFLEDMFRQQDFEFVPVLGNAGTGKSHLVRWLAENIPPAPNRHVLLIPKVDTNLWDVLHRILGLDGVRDDPQFDDYRARLRRARGELRSEKEGREKLLNNLAVACGENGPHKMQGLSEPQLYLTQHLPNLLYDPFFRESLLTDGSVIDRLVRHTIGKSEAVERLEEKRGFKEDDLPLKAADTKRASAKARAFYSQLIGERTLQTEAVDWLNRHLSTAIAELLELRGDALLRLMLEMRETLGAKGTELVLLIEDFAKLQGIDMQLLEAVIARPNQEGRGRLCAMRTVLACTKGYFGTLFDTVQTRVGFCVTLDVQSGDGVGQIVSDAEVEQFFARYLNAVRVRENALAEWFNARSDGDSADLPPNCCVDCQFREPCHSAFGSRDGVGLYPFTPTAIRRMAHRASPDGFNPRFLIKDVLKVVLGTYAEDIRAGTFPPLALLEHFKGVTLKAAEQSEVARLDNNPATRDRRLTLLDLWTTGGKVTDLHPGIHEAFSLPLLRSGPVIAPPTPPPVTPKSPAAKKPETAVPVSELPSSPALPDTLERRLRHLDEWANGTKLEQDAITSLRPLVFDTVKARINWDAELLVEGHFSGQEAKRPFRQRSVNFENQKPNKTAAVIRLTIAVDPTTLVDATLALQGLLLFDHYKNWHFRYGNHSGSFYFRKYAVQLEGWAKTVIDQIRHPTASGAAWNPAPAAAELLSLTARMANRPVASKTSLDEQLSALFVGLESVEVDLRATAWRELFRTLRDHQIALAELLLAHAACTKGGRKKVKVVDAVQLLDTLRAVRKDYLPKEPIPTDHWETHDVVRKTREKVESLLSRAIEEEKVRHLAWHDRVRAELGAEATRDELVEAVRAVMQAARDEAVFAGVSRERIEAALDAFGRERLEQCLEAMERIRGLNETGPLLIELGRDYGKLMKTVDDFIDLTGQFLTASRRRAESEIEQLEGAGELKAAEQAIAENLDQLHALLAELAGDTP